MSKNSENSSLTGSWVTLNHIGSVGLNICYSPTAPFQSPLKNRKIRQPIKPSAKILLLNLTKPREQAQDSKSLQNSSHSLNVNSLSSSTSLLLTAKGDETALSPIKQSPLSECADLLQDSSHILAQSFMFPNDGILDNQHSYSSCEHLNIPICPAFSTSTQQIVKTKFSNGPRINSHALIQSFNSNLKGLRARKKFPHTPPNTPTVKSEPCFLKPEETSVKKFPEFQKESGNSDLQNKVYQHQHKEVVSAGDSSWESVERMLKEAARERIPYVDGTRSPSDWSSPMYPTSPYPELRDLKEEFKDTDWIWDWSNGILPFREDSIYNPYYNEIKTSFRNSKTMKTLLFSPTLLSWLLITNAFSLAIGTGIGIYLGIQWYNSHASLN
ncbi:unnamed protein product [Gordionus sp. m RMFG-2023]|uniref:uncharacterized protein LOC135927171 n=1 Tax=Gordionus sp. m RMFG-2023 TaxID=3053472 RepID=UPI0030E25DCC